MNNPSAADLAAVALFAGLTEPEREQLASQFEVEEFDAGRVILHEGASGYAFYVIDQGTVEVAHDGTKLRELGRGDCFGEMSIVGEGRRTASVTALETVVVWVLFGTSFRMLQLQSPEIAQRVSDLVAERSVSTEA